VTNARPYRRVRNARVFVAQLSPHGLRRRLAFGDDLKQDFIHLNTGAQLVDVLHPHPSPGEQTLLSSVIAGLSISSCASSIDTFIAPLTFSAQNSYVSVTE
jgi:hypothetical protein